MVSSLPMIFDSPPKRTPFFYTTRYGFRRVAEWLVTSCPVDVNVCKDDVKMTFLSFLELDWTELSVVHRPSRHTTAA
jgi:hypothetical protein